MLQELGRRVPYAFLEDLKERFLRAHGDAAQDAVAYEFDESFSAVIQQRMEYFSKDRSADTINRVRGEISEVRNIMIENIDKVSSRLLAEGLACVCACFLARHFIPK